MVNDPDEIVRMLALRKELDPDAPDVIVFPENQTPLIRDVGDYEIVVTEKQSHWIGFKVYRVLGTTASGVRMYNRDGYQSSPDPVEDRDAAQVAISGSIKWDGCSDFTIEDEPLHFCGRSDIEEFADLFSAIYDLAAELIPSYEVD